MKPRKCKRKAEAQLCERAEASSNNAREEKTTGDITSSSYPIQHSTNTELHSCPALKNASTSLAFKGVSLVLVC